MARTPENILRIIEQSDPDGGSRKPTKEDYRQFEVWIEQTYGKQALKDYYRAGRRD